MQVTLEPLTAEAFAQYGHIVTLPAPDERKSLAAILQNLRPSANAILSLTSKRPDALPLNFPVMERHPYSSQAFLPIKASRYVVVVAPKTDAGAPDIDRCKAFYAMGDQGVVYNADTWHCPLSVLDEDASFCVFLYREGRNDEEFVELPMPISIR